LSIIFLQQILNGKLLSIIGGQKSNISNELILESVTTCYLEFIAKV